MKQQKPITNCPPGWNRSMLTENQRIGLVTSIHAAAPNIFTDSELLAASDLVLQNVDRALHGRPPVPRPSTPPGDPINNRAELVANSEELGLPCPELPGCKPPAVWRYPARVVTHSSQPEDDLGLPVPSLADSKK